MKINKGMSILLASMLISGSMAKPIEAKPYDEYRFCCDNCGNLAYYDDGDYYDDKDNEICWDCAIGIWEDGGITYDKPSNAKQIKLTVDDIHVHDQYIEGNSEEGATVTAYVDGKQIGTTKVYDGADWWLISKKKINTDVGKKIKIVASKHGYKDTTVTKTVKISELYDDLFTFNKFSCDDTKLNGKIDSFYSGKNLKMVVYKGGKKLGIMKISGNTMSCKIPKQKTGTKLTIKISGKGYKTITKTVKVIDKYYKCKYGKKHYYTHSCGCKYMTSSVRKNLKKYEVYNVKVKDIYGDIGCSGTFVNNTKTRWDYVEIMVKFYDKNGHVLCTNFTNTLDVAPKEKWNWKVLGCDTSKTSYVRITKITTSKY